MGYVIGYVAAPFIIAFCIVHFFLRKRYLKKHKEKMGIGSVIGSTVGIAIVIMALSAVGSLS